MFLHCADATTCLIYSDLKQAAMGSLRALLSSRRMASVSLQSNANCGYCCGDANSTGRTVHFSNRFLCPQHRVHQKKPRPVLFMSLSNIDLPPLLHLAQCCLPQLHRPVACVLLLCVTWPRLCVCVCVCLASNVSCVDTM